MKLNLDFYSSEKEENISEEEKNIYEKYFSESNKNIEIQPDTQVSDYQILSNFRKNIISWYEFKEKSDILELNANFGELTGYLSEKAESIVSVVNNKQKGYAILNRYPTNKNLEVIVGDIEKININKNFDYITIIGEENGTKFAQKLKFAKEHIKQDGKILVAFNNKFGMQYWTGLKDDCAKQYEAILGKSSKNSLNKIEKDLKESEFNYKIYYPLPDYKITNVIFSDEYLPDIESMMSRNLIYAREDENLEFGQREAYIELLKENKNNFKLFANSYFLEISKQDIENEIRYVNFEVYRKKEYNIKTIIKKDVVIKTANIELAQNHINNIKKNIDILKSKKIKTLDKYEDNKIISKFVNNAISYDKYIVDICKSEGKEKAIKLIENLKSEILDKFEIINKPNDNVFEKYNVEENFEGLHYIQDGLIDLNASNCFFIDNELYVYDQEWYEKNVPLEFILYRTLFYNHNLSKYISKEELYEHFKITKYVQKFEELDNAIQDSIRNNYFWNLHAKTVSYVGKRSRKIAEINNALAELKENLSKELKNNQELNVECSKLKDNVNQLTKEVERCKTEKENDNKSIENLNQQISIYQGKSTDFENRLRIIEKSFSWKITKPLRYMAWVLNFRNKMKLVDRLMPPGSNMRAKHEEKKHQKILNTIAKKYCRYTDEETAKRWANLVEIVNEEPKNRVHECDYDYWIDSNDPTEEELENQRNYKFDYEPKISIVTPLYNTPIEFFRDLLFFLHEQTYSNWELCLADGSKEPLKEIKSMIEKEPRIKYTFIGENKGISGNTNEALKLVTGDYVALLDHDDYLSKDCLFEVVKTINENENVEFIYTDEDKSSGVGEKRYDAYFKPDFAPDTLRSQNYICHFSVFKKDVMDKLKGFRSEYDGAQDYDIFLRMSEIVLPENIKHISKILYHWRVHRASTAQLNSNAKNYAFDNGIKALEDHLKRINLEGTVSKGCLPGIYRIDYKVQGNPKVSIIIPNKDGKDILEICLNSIIEKTTYNNYEIVVVENNSITQEIFDYYDEIQKKYSNVKVVKYPEQGFNYAGIINFGVRESDGEYIIQLNNDTELLTPNWLELMVGFAQRKDVGGVGVKMYYPDETIQHAGVIVGLGGVAGHRFKNLPKDGHAYFAKESMIEDLSAVTAACIMNSRKVYEDVDFMDEKFAVAFNDVDFCLKIREKGYLIVYNPYIEFIHYESKSRGYENTPEKIKRFQGEIKRFRDKWGDFVENGDPYYNKNLEDGSEQYPIKHCKVN